MNEEDVVYNIIRNQFFNNILAKSINRDDLIEHVDCLKKILRYVDSSDSQRQSYEIIINRVIYSGDVSLIMKCANFKNVFDKFIYILSIAKILVEYLKENKNTEDVNKIIGKLSEYLDESSFKKSLFVESRYITCIENSYFDNKTNLSKSYFSFKKIMLFSAIGGIAGAATYFLKK